ncbi:MAG: flagellar basal-body rod protein FlgG [Hydrogenophilales bacterium 17-61-76]|nr:MAG: flagellar basal-body rod protein FlgG [Hydrogenophilales bacterium 17-61-76]
MIRSLWIAKTGLEAQQTQMDVISNNLANVSTTGFKRARAVFEDLLYQTIRQPGAQSSEQTQLPSGLQLGTGVKPVATERIFTQGNLQLTGNSKDVAIQGQGFFQVLMPDGTTSYTRDGSFQIDANGQLVTSSGYAVQPAITLPADTQSLTIAMDGTVSVTQAGSATPVTVGTLQLATFINPAGLQSLGQNLYAETGASGTPGTNAPGSNGAGTLNQNYIETSNVNVVEELVNMIQTQRAQPTTARPQPVVVQAPANGAILQTSAFRPLFEDRSARLVGDTLTIVISEKTQAGKKGSSSGSKTGALQSSIGNIVGLPLKMFQGLGVTADSSSEYDDDSAINSSNTFNGSVTVTVIEVLPNGNLVVAGEKQIALDKGTEYIRLSGVVQPDTIQAGNTVSSTKVADARIEYRTSANFDKAEVMGWMARFFLSFVPL